VTQQKHYLAELGLRVLARGYPIIPIRPGEKRPPWRGWEKIHATPDLVKKWVGNGQAESGVGILAATVPGVDLDIRDIQAAEHMERWVLEHIGPAPIRFGAWPKRLLMFRTDAPFPKVQSRKYVDGWGNDAKVEILGDGQQFVSHHIHPDTGKPYWWIGGRGPHSVPRDELTELTAEQAQAIVAEFERMAAELGWTLKVKTELAPLAPKAAVADPDDWSADIDLKGPVGIDADTMRQKLMLIPAFETYNEWLGICAALKHEYQDDDETGLELFIDYSSRCSNFNEDECREKWDTFRRSDRAGAKTARWILALAKEAEREASTERRQEVETALAESKTLEDVLKAAALAKVAPFEKHTRNLIAGRLRSAYKRVTGDSLSIRDSRDMIRFEDPERQRMPPWVKGWVYCTDDSLFFHRETGTSMTRQAFNDAHARRMLSRRDVLEGRAFPEVQPADAALSLFQIPIVRTRMYKPDEDDIFTLNGVAYVNTYSDRSVPDTPEQLRMTERQDVALAERHFAHLIPNERDRRLFLSYLAYVVKTQKRPNWALVLQGIEGDGKSWIFHLMAAALGVENVGMLTGDILEDRFTAWAEGRLFSVVEEVRWHGHNRFDILNRIKPFITNAVVQIRRMHRDPYLIPNTAAYLLLTNYRDALPVGDSDSRYFVVHSPWQVKSALEDFKRENPDYYPHLYRAVQRSAGALRKWLLEYELDEEFDPAGRAPSSIGKRYMVDVAKTEEQEAVEDILAAGEPELSRELLNATLLADKMADDGMVAPATRTINKLLSDLGFTYLGRHRIGKNKARYWSQQPERFVVEGDADPNRIREYLAKR